MPTSDVPSRPEIILLVFGYLSISQAHVLPDGAAVLGYATGFFLFVLIPLLILDETDSRSESSSSK
ncbi:hypothetical protein ZOD2009_08803 [Haladaptatus paucihalophilus DX253]|uniref:Uncharacterized protein n=1 Tax=Haladaptatus paucihalophilus DX253 TaxID=797209 RepID=E7QSI5_HALPU|nr:MULTISPECIES: hypothetical protein [Haladaptatus]EFW92394.1 hypothetical protein ZOD2009_08803 [Haladaptatus paucihalophilus DX253]